MSLKENFNTIINVIKDKRALTNMAKSLNAKNKKQQELELYTNSVARELINIFYSVADKSAVSAVNIEHMLIEPNKLSNKKEIGSIKDPRILIQAVQLDEQFKLNFDIKLVQDENGNDQYLISKKKFKV